MTRKRHVLGPSCDVSHKIPSTSLAFFLKRKISCWRVDLFFLLILSTITAQSPQTFHLSLSPSIFCHRVVFRGRRLHRGNEDIWELGWSEYPPFSLRPFRKTVSWWGLFFFIFFIYMYFFCAKFSSLSVAPFVLAWPCQRRFFFAL